MPSIRKTAVIITVISLVCKFFGFGREMILAYFFGTTYIVDAYLVANNLPIILFGFLVSISYSFTPIYKDIKHNIGFKESNAFVNNILSIILLIAVIGIFLGIIFNKQIVSIAAPGFSGEVFDLTTYYFNISIWLILFMSPIQILIAFLNCNGKFVSSNISLLAISIGQFITVIIAGIINNSSILVYGAILANILQLSILYFFSKRQGYKSKYDFKISPEIKKAFMMVIPIMLNGMATQINIFVDKSFASKLVEGSIAALNYGHLLSEFILVVFSMAITTMIYPILSQKVAEKRLDDVKNIFIKAVNVIIILFIPLTIGSIILASPAISFVFERGEFNNNSTVMTTLAFIMYSIGLLALALREVITKVFFSMQDTKSILLIGVFAVALNILFNILLIKHMGHSGLALATSLSAIISIPIFFIKLRKRLGSLSLKKTLLLFIKSCIATSFMGIVVYIVSNWTLSILFLNKLNILFSISLSAVIGCILYFVIMILLKVKEMDFFIDTFKNIFVKLTN